MWQKIIDLLINQNTHSNNETNSVIIPINDSDELSKPSSSGNLLGMIVQKMLNINLENDEKNDVCNKEIEEKEHFEDDTREFKIIPETINDLNDLIKLGKNSEMYSDENIRYNIDMKVIRELVEPLQNFNKLIGLF